MQPNDDTPDLGSAFILAVYDYSSKEAVFSHGGMEGAPLLAIAQELFSKLIAMHIEQQIGGNHATPEGESVSGSEDGQESLGEDIPQEVREG